MDPQIQEEKFKRLHELDLKLEKYDKLAAEKKLQKQNSKTDKVKHKKSRYVT